MNGLRWQALVRWRTSGLEYPALFIKLNSLSRLAAPLLLNTQFQAGYDARLAGAAWAFQHDPWLARLAGPQLT
jgi:hypothetical protein